jgi:hypothetical protein
LTPKRSGRLVAPGGFAPGVGDKSESSAGEPGEPKQSYYMALSPLSVGEAKLKGDSAFYFDQGQDMQ